ncbi:MAG: hypothetical protein MUC95_03690 [Spirochaetes bacterium]|nr:hypothetical protein [Spirochaetota bacterium]
MKILTKYIICIFILICSCTYSKFVLTGNKYDPYVEDRDVKVIPWGNQSEYDVIGIAEIGESDIESRISEAKRIARLNGGDVIAPKGIESGDSAELGDVGYRLQSFMILKSREVKEVARAETPPPRETPRIETTSENYPKASFKLLREEAESLQGQKFQGAMYPYKVYDVPSQLMGFAEGEKKLVELRTKNRNSKIKVYMMFPGDQVNMIENIINTRQVFKFVYTPVTVYKRKYPVVDFIAVLE